MRTLIIGIDSGTQSTKALVVNARTGQVHGKGSAAYDLIPNLPTGAKEQHPRDWSRATAKAIKAALKEADVKSGEVVAIGVSGQQHGFVPLDKSGEVIRPAKLWCDTATAAECDEITAKLGGQKKLSPRSATPFCPASRRQKFSGSKSTSRRILPGSRPFCCRTTT